MRRFDLCRGLFEPFPLFAHSDLKGVPVGLKTCQINLVAMGDVFTDVLEPEIELSGLNLVLTPYFLAIGELLAQVPQGKRF